MVKTIIDSFNGLTTFLLTELTTFLTGVLAAILGFFIPVKDIVHLLIVFFIVDMIFGFLAAKKGKKTKPKYNKKGKEIDQTRFSTTIIWNTTIPRMTISVILVVASYAWDYVFHQNVVDTFNIVGWFISGILLYSIAENGYYITNWYVLKRLANLLKKKVTEKEDEQSDDITQE